MMASGKTFAVAFMALLCLCTHALAATHFDYYALVLMWPASYCYQTNAGCCLPTTGKPALDFFITGLHTYNSTTGAAVTKCEKSSFYINDLAELSDELNEYWSNIKCPNTDGKSLWKNSWKTSGVCSGLTQHDYFETALELRNKLNLLSILEKNDIVPSGENFYSVEDIMKVIKENLGVDVLLQCSKNKNKEWQLYQVYFCIDKDASTLISCPSSMKKFTCGEEITFSVFTSDMLTPAKEYISVYTS